LKTNILTLLFFIVNSHVGMGQNCGTPPNDGILVEKTLSFWSNTEDSLHRTNIARYNEYGMVVSISTITHEDKDTLTTDYNYNNQKLIQMIEYSKDTTITIVSDWNEHQVATRLYSKKDSTNYTVSNYKGCFLLKKEHYSNNLKVIESDFKWENNLLMGVETRYLTNNIRTDDDIEDQIINYKYTKFDEFGNWTERLVMSNNGTQYLEKRILEYK
jgi:hypothetical protein